MPDLTFLLRENVRVLNIEALQSYALNHYDFRARIDHCATPECKELFNRRIRTLASLHLDKDVAIKFGGNTCLVTERVKCLHHNQSSLRQMFHALTE